MKPSVKNCDPVVFTRDKLTFPDLYCVFCVLPVVNLAKVDVGEQVFREMTSFDRALNERQSFQLESMAFVSVKTWINHFDCQVNSCKSFGFAFKTILLAPIHLRIFYVHKSLHAALVFCFWKVRKYSVLATAHNLTLFKLETPYCVQLDWVTGRVAEVAFKRF